MFDPLDPETADRDGGLLVVGEVPLRTSKPHQSAIHLALTRITQCECDLARHALIEPGERFELAVLEITPIQPAVHRRKLFARLVKSGIQIKGFPERLNGLPRPLQLMKRNAQQVMRLGKAIVQLHRATQ